MPPTVCRSMASVLALASAVVAIVCAAAPAAAQPTPNVIGAVAPAVVNVGDTVLLTFQAAPGYPVVTMAAPETDLREIGGGTVATLNDLGLAGDVVAGDHIYSLRIPVRYPTFEGVKHIRIVNAGSSAGVADVDLTIIAPPGLPSATGQVVPVGAQPGFSPRGAAVQILVNATPGSGPISTGLRVTLDLSRLGLPATTDLSDDGGFACDATAGDRVFTACVVLPRDLTLASPFSMNGTVSDAQGRSTPFSVTTAIVDWGDTDGDGLSDPCEDAFGLDAAAPTGVNGAAGDPDADGITNAGECSGLTHPRGTFTRYFAEGASNAFFKTRLSFFNPSATTSAIVLATFYRESGGPRRVRFTVPAHTVVNLMAADTASLGEGPFSTIVESDLEVVCDRIMTFGADEEGSHIETAVRTLVNGSYFAESATGWRFSLFYLLFNPHPFNSTVSCIYETARGTAVFDSYLLGPFERRTIHPAELESPSGSGEYPLAATEFTAQCGTFRETFVMERALYMSPEGHPFGAGSVAAGTTNPYSSWLFAEGATGAFFDEFLVLHNGEDYPVTATIVFTPERGSPITRQYALARFSRATIHVDLIPGLENTSVSASVAGSLRSVERVMWWPGSGESWRESHVTAGVPAGSPKWAIAGLEVGGAHDAQSYILVRGGGAVTIYSPSGGPISCGTSSGGRFTVHVNDCPGLRDGFAGAVIQGNADTVVEWVTYRSANGEPFAAGGAAVAVPIP